MKVRPLKRYDGRLAPPRSTTLCRLGPKFVHTTWPPTPTVTEAGVNTLSVIETYARLGPPVTTSIVPAIDGPWIPQK